MFLNCYICGVVQQAQRFASKDTSGFSYEKPAAQLMFCYICKGLILFQHHNL